MTTSHRYRTSRKVTLVGAAVNALLATSQIICGLLGQSQALFADGLHTLSDLASDCIVLFAVKQAALAPDEGHPFGHGRIETLASVLLGLILIGVGVGIGYRGIDTIFSNQQVMPAPITLFFAALAIGSKEFLYHYTMKAARAIHSTLLETNAWHHRSDALSSVVVLVGIAAQIAGLPYMDAGAAVIVALMIARMGYKLSLDALRELIDTSLDSELVDSLKSLMQNTESVQAVHSLRTRSMGGLGYIDAEIRVNPRLTVSEAHFIAFSLEQQVKSTFPQIIDVSIHVDPVTESGHESVNDLPTRQHILQQLRESWQSSPCSEAIEQVHLHYLNRRLEIDIVLPAAFSTEDCRPDVDQLVAQTLAPGLVGKVNVYFTRAASE